MQLYQTTLMLKLMLLNQTTQVSVLNTLNGKTGGRITVTDDSPVLTGNASDSNDALEAGSTVISGIDNAGIILTDTSLDISVLNTLNSNTTGTVNASSITTLSGAAADCNTAYSVNASGGEIVGLGEEAITLSDTTLAVSVLNTLDGNTSGTINANTITTLTGTAAACNTAYDSGSGNISNLGNENITLTDTALAVSVLNILDGNTTGTIDAESINTLTGTASACNTAYSSGSNNISNLREAAITLTDTTLAVSVLNTLDDNTSGTINANTITTLTGTAAACNTAYISSGIDD